MRRLITKMGVALLLALGLSASAMAADGASAPGSTQENQQQSAVTVETNQSVTVTDTQQSSQTVGSPAASTPSDPASNPVATTSPEAPKVAGPAVALNFGSEDTKAGDPKSAPAGIADTATAPGQSQPTLAKIIGDAVKDTGYTLTSPSSRVTGLLQATASRQTASSKKSAPPTPGEPFGGLLLQLRNLLADIFVPVPATISASALADIGFPILTMLLTVCLLIYGIRLPLSTYTTRLRRSGFLGAPRSDIAASQSFATPLKWVLSSVHIT